MEGPNSLFLLVFNTCNNIYTGNLKRIAAGEQFWEFTGDEIIHSFGYKYK